MFLSRVSFLCRLSSTTGQNTELLGDRLKFFLALKWAVYVFDRNQPSLPTPFYSVLVSVSVFMALSTVYVFHFIGSLDNSPLSHSVLSVLFLPYWSFQLYISLMKVPLSPDIILCA